MSEIVKKPSAEQLPTFLSPAAEQYLRESLSPNTRRAYRAQISKWVEWCAQKRVEPWPADLVQVVNYLSERADAGQAVSTIRTAVSAIKFGHEAQGLPFDSRAPAIVKVLKGITRTSGKIAKQAEPIRAHDAFRAITVEDDANVIELRDAAVIATGYLFALRRSELVGLDYGKHGDGDGVLRFTSHAIELTLVRSKTASKGGEPERVTIPRAGNEAAIAILKRYIDGAGIKQGTALFRRIWKSGVVGPRLSAQSVNLIAKRLVGHEYSGHSLRVGFAVSAAEAGVDLRSIATVTRHASMEMPRRYAERADQLRTSPYKVAGVGLSSDAEQVRL